MVASGDLMALAEFYLYKGDENLTEHVWEFQICWTKRQLTKFFVNIFLKSSCQQKLTFSFCIKGG
jgi:hypothetical protein